MNEYDEMGYIAIYSLDGALVDYRTYKDTSARKRVQNIWSEKYKKNKYFLIICPKVLLKEKDKVVLGSITFHSKNWKFLAQYDYYSRYERKKILIRWDTDYENSYFVTIKPNL